MNLQGRSLLKATDLSSEEFQPAGRPQRRVDLRKEEDDG